MPRSRRITLPGYPHHVTPRGNRKANVFLDDRDRHVYIKMLVEQCIAQAIRIWAYCLMDNHVHIIAVPAREDSLSRAFQRLHSSYATYFNLRYSKTGHLWQGRFKSAVMDTPHLWNGVRYVERNPPFALEWWLARRTSIGRVPLHIVACDRTTYFRTISHCSKKSQTGTPGFMNRNHK